MASPNINYGFLEKLEGSELAGYVPSDNSGVTIGTGVDLSSKDVQGLTKLGVSPETIKLVTPYLGKVGSQAKNYLQQNPLKLAPEQVQELNSLIFDSSVNALAKKFNASSSVKFEDLPPEFQTVLASVNYQYGTGALEKMNFWQQMTNKRYDEALNNLRNFKDKYPTRRNKEADLFEQGIINQFLGSNP
jgi:GH24 family phage-related lysozyme (muramidase)